MFGYPGNGLKWESQEINSLKQMDPRCATQRPSANHNFFLLITFTHIQLGALSWDYGLGVWEWLPFLTGVGRAANRNNLLATPLNGFREQYSTLLPLQEWSPRLRYETPTTIGRLYPFTSRRLAVHLKEKGYSIKLSLHFKAPGKSPFLKKKKNSTQSLQSKSPSPKETHKQ